MTVWQILFLGWLFGRRNAPGSQESAGKTPKGFGYPTCFATLFILVAVSLPFTLCILEWQGFGVTLTVIWYSILATISAAMFGAVWREHHATS